MSKHSITAIYNPDDVEIEVRIGFTLHPYVPMRGPSYASGGEPEEPASIEFDRVEKRTLDGWIAAPELSEWAEAFLHTEGEADAFECARDDEIAGEEYRAEMRAQRWKEIY